MPCVKAWTHLFIISKYGNIVGLTGFFNIWKASGLGEGKPCKYFCKSALSGRLSNQENSLNVVTAVL